MGNASRKLTPSKEPRGTRVLENSTPCDADYLDPRSLTPDDYLDPRSPTPDVSRTPLGNTEALKHKITKNVDLSKTLEIPTEEEKVFCNNPILSAVIRNHLRSFDPRSPTQEFERTPIIINSDVNSKLWRDCNDSVVFDNDYKLNEEGQSQLLWAVPRNLSEELLDSTLDSTFKDSEPLGSSTASQDAIENVASPFTNEGLLETDFDFVPEDNILKPDVLIKENNIPVLSALEKLKVSDKDPRSPSQGIDRTPIVLPHRVSVIPNDKPVENMSEELLVAALQCDIADFRRTPAAPADRGLLIYEDDCTKDITPRKTKSTNTGTRTPLSCVKNKTEDRLKSASDIGSKKKVASRIPKRVSGIQKALSKECEMEHENNPPEHHPQVWDNESSVVL